MTNEDFYRWVMRHDDLQRIAKDKAAARLWISPRTIDGYIRNAEPHAIPGPVAKLCALLDVAEKMAQAIDVLIDNGWSSQFAKDVLKKYRDLEAPQ